MIQPARPHNSQNKNDETPWWNRPIYLQDLFQDAVAPFNKPPVPEDIVALHDRALQHTQNFAQPAKTLENEKFGSPEFTLFAKIKYYLARNIGEYKGLHRSIQLLQVAIKAKDNYLRIEQTELRYRGSKQQELYNYVIELLSQDLTKDEFQKKVKQKLAEVLPLVKTDEGRQALQAYIDALETLSDDELGLKLLSLFKQYQLSDYSILRTISEIVVKLQKEDLYDTKGLVVKVRLKYETFQKMGKIIGVKGKRSNPEVYAKMLQYIAMNYKYGITYVQFDQLLKILKQWEEPFKKVVALREEYNAKEYKQPKGFAEEIPGLELYKKYQEFLEKDEEDGEK